MKGLIFLLIAAMLLAACGSSNSVPAGIIPSQQMETILWQIMEADQYMTTVLAKDSTKKSNVERSRIYQQIFELNKTSREAFQKSYQFYITHPEITKIVFDSITAKATRQRTDMYQHKPDSAVKRPGMDTALQHHGLPPVDSAIVKHPFAHIIDSALKSRKKPGIHTSGRHKKRK